MSLVDRRKTALFERLEPAGRQKYWDALSRFLCFDIDKVEFERLTLLTLNPDDIALHNGKAYTKQFKDLRRRTDSELPSL
jgi:hypothetical protein